MAKNFRCPRSLLVLLLIFSGFLLVVTGPLLAGRAAGAVSKTTKPPTSKSPASRLPIAGTWKKVFDDEFNGDSLDRSKWYPSCQWGSSATFYCVNTAYPSHTCFQPGEVKVGKGLLTLTLIKRKSVCENGKAYPYTSGFIDTTHDGLPPHFQFRYGYLEARIKMPSSRGGPGYWPGFWSGPARGGWPPEVDVVEWNSRGDPALKLGPDSTSAFYHMSCRKTVCRAGNAVRLPFNPSGGFHAYSLDWEPNGITWFVDGHQILRYRGHTPDQPMDLRLDLSAVAKQVSRKTRFPARMEVQWVRVWQRR